MKILFTNFHHRNGGGHVTYIVNLAKALAADHEVTVATPGTSRLFRYAGAVKGVATVDICYTSRLFQMVPEVLRLRRLIKGGNFDVVHVNGSADHRHIMLACIGLVHRPKIIWTKHNDHSVNSVGHRLRARFGTDGVIAVSAYVADLLKGSPYSDTPTQIVRHGIDIHYFSPVAALNKTELRLRLLGPGHDNSMVLGSTGGTDYDKGWLDLAAALGQLSPEEQQHIKIVVAGDPPNAEKQDRVRALGVQEHIIFPGLLDDVRDTLAACDAGFVLSYREALSFACRESLAMGLPTLVSDAGGLPENIIHEVDGWIVPARNPAAIADVLHTLLDSPERLHKMARAARQKAEHDFSLNRFVQATVHVYQQALDAR